MQAGRDRALYLGRSDGAPLAARKPAHRRTEAAPCWLHHLLSELTILVDLSFFCDHMPSPSLVGQALVRCSQVNDSKRRLLQNSLPAVPSAVSPDQPEREALFIKAPGRS